jgi:hypothetical protein
MANLDPAVGDVYSLDFYWKTQVVSDLTTGPTRKVPFKGRIVKVLGNVDAIGGTTVHTDIDIVIKDGSTVVATCAAVDGSAIVSGGAIVETNHEVDAGDVLEMEIDITGGSSPTADGVSAQLWIVRT